MNIILFYTRVLTKIDRAYSEPAPGYPAGMKRFHDTYAQFKPAIPHKLIVVNCGEALDESGRDLDGGEFNDIADGFDKYNGGGWDCGTYQAVAARHDADLMIGFNTLSYFWRPGWLEPFVSALGKHGPGVFGPSASRETNHHLRTPCIAFTPEILRAYPLKVIDRGTCCQFEHGPDNFSLWAERQGHPSLLVTEDGEWAQKDWRKPDNIFRRGDQSNCLVWDRHTLIYEQASPADKLNLERAANA